MSVDVEIKGMLELQANLTKLAKVAPESTVKHAALIVQRSAMQHATGRPGPNVITGRLRSSINIEIESLTSARVGTAVQYASSVEYGHSQQVGRFVPMFSAGQKNVRGPFAGTYNGQGLGLRLVNPTAPAYPFMTPAAADLRGQFPELSVQVRNDIEHTSWKK